MKFTRFDYIYRSVYCVHTKSQKIDKIVQVNEKYQTQLNVHTFYHNFVTYYKILLIFNYFLVHTNMVIYIILYNKLLDPIRYGYITMY